MTLRCLMFAPLLLAAAAPDAPVTVETTRTGMAGTWAGKLEYCDYQADRWFGIPVVTTIEAIGDGRTLVRKSVYDDGPRVGAVHITGVALYDSAAGTEQSATFRAGKPVDPVSTARLRLTVATDATHWTLVEERDGTDADRPAHIRETTVRDGATMTTLKEVDFADDAATTWLSRNRSTLTRR